MKQKAFYILVSLISLVTCSPAQTVGETRAFADSLYATGHLDEALPVYQRSAFFNRPVADAEVLSRIADCFISGGDLEKALEFYDHSYFAQTNDSIKKEVLFRKAACYLRSHNYNFALMELLSLDDSLSPGFERKRNFYLGMVWFGLEDFTKAGGYFEKSTADPLGRQKIRVMFADTRPFYRPHPKLASWLSIFIPGAGQIYSGEIWSGVNSLFLTGFFVGLGFYVVTVSSPIDALFTALPWFQRYYQGGFQRASDFAKNKRAENRSRIFDQVLTVIANNK
jgi:tetratricopeptide (TPR) repeat protein